MTGWGCPGKVGGIKIVILVLAFCFGAVLISGCTLSKWQQILPTGADIEKTCCQECLDFISKTPGSEKCLANQKISEECREFFEKNPEKEKDCLEGKIVALPGTILPGQEDHNQLLTQFNELKGKYENKKWHGTVKGEVVIDAGLPNGDLTKTYTLRIDEMWINFNAPDSGSYTRLYPGSPRISIDGKAVLESAHWWDTRMADAKIYISSFPFKLDGVIDFSKGTINLHPEDPDAQEEFRVRYTYYDPEMKPRSFFGDNETLSSIFDPHMPTFKFEGDKIILTGLDNPPSNAKGNMSGELSPF